MNNNSRNITRDNHYISQVLLKNWSEDNIHILTYRTLVPHCSVKLWEMKPIKGIAYHRDLYTITNNGIDDDSYEKWLGKEVESPINESFQKIRLEKKLSKLDIDRLVTFLATHDLRTPSSYFRLTDHWNRTGEEFLEKTINNSLEKYKLLKKTKINYFLEEDENNSFSDLLNISVIDNSEDVNDGAKYIKAEFSTGRRFWLHQQRHNLNTNLHVLLNHKWSIGRCSKKNPWLLSDNPVIKLNILRDGTYNFGGGWGSKGTFIFMPLSPRHIIFTIIGKEFPDYKCFKISESRFIQKIICESTDRYIFSTEENTLVTKLLPRVENQDLYNKENILWTNWHTEQNAFDHLA